MLVRPQLEERSKLSYGLNSKQYTMKSAQQTVQFETLCWAMFPRFTLPWVGVWGGEKRLPDFRTK